MIEKRTVKTAIRQLRPSLLIMAALITAQAHAQSAPPASKRFVGTGIAPATAFSYYGTATTHTNGIAASAQRSPEIKALARALSRDGTLTGDAFAQRTADWVRRNIETEFTFGLGKGARGAAIDQSGTVFDQAELMAEILREGGMSATYQLGTITLNAAQFGQWTGLVTGLNQSAQTFTVNARAACQMLANGGIPATVNGASDCTQLSGNLSTVTLAHLWVIANGKAYDPGFKVNVLKAGIDVPAAMGCGTAAAPTCGSGIQSAATAGASQGSSPAPWIQNVSQSGVESYVQARALSLQSAIEGSDPTAPLNDVIGGMDIDQKQTTSGASSLPYQGTTQASWTATIPDQFRTKFRIQFQGLDTTFFADEIVGKRLRLTTGTSYQQFNRTSNIIMDGGVLATAQVTSQPQAFDVATLSVDHPFASNNGTYADDVFAATLGFDPRDSSGNITYSSGGQTTVMGMTYGAISTLIFDVGRAGPNREQHFNRLMMDQKEIGTVISDSNGFLVNYHRIKPEPVTAARLAYQSTLETKIVQSLLHDSINNLHNLGAVFSISQFLGGDDNPYFNLISGLTSTSITNASADENAGFRSVATIAAALEGSVPQQGEDAFESAASASIFKLANDQSTRFYLANSGNISSVLNATSGFSSGRKQFLTNYALQGYSVVVPSKGSIGTISLTGGGGTIALSVTPEIVSSSSAIGYLVNELYKGGGSVDPKDPVKSTMDTVKANATSAKDKKAFNVDLASGNLNLALSPDLSVGSGPGALSLSRRGGSFDSAFYRCTEHDQPISGTTVVLYSADCIPANMAASGGIAGGWKHNHNLTASWSGSGAEGLGATTALRASKAIAAIYGLADLNRASSQTIAGQMASVFTTYSLINSFVRNSVSLSDDGLFILLPSGRYDSPPALRGASLVETGAPSAPFDLTDQHTVRRSYAGTSITLTNQDGGQVTYMPSEGFGYPAGYSGTTSNGGPYNADNEPKYAATNVADSIGNKITYSYTIKSYYDFGTSMKYISQVSNSFGNSINFIGTNASLNSVSDQAGRSVAFSCANNEPTLTTTNPSGFQGSGLAPATGFVEFALLCSGSAQNPLNGVTSSTLATGDGAYAGSDYPDRLPKSWFTPLNASTAFLNIAYDPLLHVASLQDINSHTTKFFSATIGGDRLRIGERQEPSGDVTSTEFDQFASPTKVTDPLGRITSNVYDSAHRLLRTVLPEGNAVEYAYDIRGNQVSECKIAKGRVTWASLTSLTERNAQCSQAAGDLVTTTVYMEGPTLRADQCANAKTCNKPSYVVDPRGNRTDYTWDPTHGQMLTETKPADAAGNRPTTTYGYTAFTGSDGATFYLLTSKQEKIDASNTTTTTYEYDASNHWALKSQIVDSGGLALRTCFKFDATGNLISKTEPRAGLTSCS